MLLFFLKRCFPVVTFLIFKNAIWKITIIVEIVKETKPMLTSQSIHICEYMYQ